MEIEILNKILEKVEKISTDLTEFKQEVYQRFEKQDQKINDLREEMNQKIDGLREEMYQLSDKNIKEIANEIHEVTRMMGTKTKYIVKKVKQEIKAEINTFIRINEKDHDIFRAQMEKLQCIEKLFLEKLFLEKNNYLEEELVEEKTA